MKKKLTTYRGSIQTAKHVAEQIAERWPGEEVRFDPYRNCMTFKQWLSLGYAVKKGEKSIKSLTLVEAKDTKGDVKKRYPKTVHLFFDLQVDKITH